MLPSMDDAPGLEAVRAAIDAVAAGPIAETVPTAVEWKFSQPDGRTSEATLWAVRTPGQFWLAAVAGTDRFLVATGDPEAVAVVRGWARDQLKVAGRTLTLPRRMGDRAEAAVAAFRADAGGPTYPPDAPAVTTGPIARGVIGVPTWWAERMPGDPEDPWLHAYTTSSEWTFNTDDGGTRATPLVVGIRGRACWVAAYGADQLHAAALEGVATQTSSFGRPRIEVGPYQLDGGRLEGHRVDLAVRMINGDEAARWGLTAAAAVDDGRVEDAVHVWRSALERGHRRAVAEDLAVAATAAGRCAQAVTLLKELGPELDGGWLARRTGWHRSIARASEAVVALLDAHVQSAPAPGPGWPWPPSTRDEVWAAVRGGPLGSTESARSPRRLQFEAALAEAREPPAVAAAAYRVAARAWAAAGQPGTAYRTLRSALRLDPESPDHFQAAVWAYADGDTADAENHVRTGLAQSPSAEALLALAPSEAVLRAIADVAQAEGKSETAARLLIRAEAASLTDREARLALARRAADEMNAPLEAARLIEEAADLSEGDAEADEREDRVEDLWLEAARLRTRGGDTAGAVAARRRAVQAGFLRPEIYRDAAANDVDPETAQWWNHLAHLLSAASPEGAPRAAASVLNKAALDALHPGGAGWLEDMKQWLDGPAPPARDQLIRGLERLESSSFPAAFSAVNDVCRRLELMPPATYVYRGDDAFGMSAWPVTPPVLLVGHQHLVEGPRFMDGDALTFALAVELAHLAGGHPLLRFESSLIGTSRSAYQTFGKYAGTAETIVDLVSLVPGIDQIAKLQRIVRLSRRVLTGWNTVNKASNLASPMLRWLGVAEDADAGGVGRERLEGAALQFRLQADRAALLLTGNARAATEAILKTSARGVVKLDALARDGLAPLLQLEADALATDEVVRLSALLGWSSGLSGANDVDPSGPGV